MREDGYNPLCNSSTNVPITTPFDASRGTSANLAPGDKLTVGEALYGLLLPSGNDAAVTLAEYFGTIIILKNRRYSEGKPDTDVDISDISLEVLQCPGELKKNSNDSLLDDAQQCQEEEEMEEKQDPRIEAFIAAMGQLVADCGARQTSFVNCHGLDEDGHYSTANDTCLLSHVAMKNEKLCHIVNTKSYSATIRGVNGERVETWNNTNKMLGSSFRGNYDGIKTGTTAQAGYCLATRGKSGLSDKSKIIVTVLSCETADKRFNDTSKLFRW